MINKIENKGVGEVKQEGWIIDRESWFSEVANLLVLYCLKA